MDTDERQLTGADFPVHWPVTTRWADNDMFGHLNNAVYYQLFDSAINGWIRTQAGVDPVSAPWLGVVAESGCRYFAELAFPDPLVVGLAVARIGTSSVTYRLGLFPVDGQVAAVGHPTRVAAVDAVGRPLLRRGVAELGLAVDDRVEARLRAHDGDGSDDVIVTAGATSTDITLGPAEGDATLETDAATRVLLLWGRRPADPTRIRSRVGPEALGRVRTLLSGY